jgi:ATP-dependent exoDNAse (exonuclease V) alpha subunit
VDRVVVHVDTQRSEYLVNQRQFYVSISRARTDARIYTNDTEALDKAASRDMQKSTAIEAVRVSVRQEQGNGRQVPREQSRGAEWSR